MLTSLLVGSDVNLGKDLEEALSATRRVVVLQRLGHYPSLQETTALLERASPDYLFLDFSSAPEAEELARAAPELAPRTCVVGFGPREDPELLLRVMRTGTREYFAPPFRKGAFHDLFGRREAASIHGAAGPEFAPVAAFLPAKMGSGATTIAVSANVSLARRGDARSLLIDFDLNAGLVGFLMRVDNPHAIIEAAQNADYLDEALWRQMICTIGSLDILPTGAYQHDFRVQADQVRKILVYGRRHYQTVSVDLSGMMEQFSLEVLMMASRIYLVSTAEIPSLHLAGQKLAYLRGLDLEDRVHILLNRCSSDPTAEQNLTEKVLGVPVQAIFPNDYRAVHRSMVDGKPVDPSSRLGHAFNDLAEALLPRPQAEADTKRRFVLPFRKSRLAF